MNARAARRAIVLLVVLNACAAVGPPPDGRPILESIQFEGNDSISGSELDSKIVTANSSGVFKKIYRTWDADLFQTDQERILRWYRTRGFFEATISRIDVEPQQPKDGRKQVRVWVHITEGRRTKVTKLTVGGLDLLTGDEKTSIEGTLPLKQGDAFDEELYEKDKATLVAELKEKGFAAAEAKGDVQVSLDTATAEVTLTATTGDRFKFGKVFISGNHAIATELIDKTARIPSGEIYQASALNLAQQRVYNLGVFSGARVSLEPLGDEPIAAVRIDVREAPFQTLRFGFGAELEQNRFELPRVRAEYTDRDFLGSARRLELVQQAGYAFVPSITSPDKTGPVSLTTAQLTLPQLIPPGIDLILRGEFSREIQYGFNYFETAARVALQYRFAKQTFVLSANFVRYFAATLDLDLGTLLTNNGTGAALLSNCVPACSLAYPEFRWTFDLRNDLIEPTKGFYATASISHTAPFGSFNFWRIAPEVRGYIPFGGIMVLAMRAQWGALILEGDDTASPFTQRFFAGGQNSNRGFGDLGQGPQVGAQPNSIARPIGLAPAGYATAALPIGGNGFSLASIELRIHVDFILDKLSVVPFVDGSRVSSSWELPFVNTLEYAPGLGLRYLTPFGPVRLDVGVLANPQDQITVSPASSVLPTPYSVGCNEANGNCIHESRWQYHLSIGEAF